MIASSGQTTTQAGWRSSSIRWAQKWHLAAAWVWGSM